MDRAELEREYANRHRTYERLAEEVTHILENGLSIRNIKFQSVLKRIKEPSSFIGKVERRQTDKPFEDITDIVGLRIVCLLRSDLLHIANLIRDSFNVVTEDDKLETQPVASFGYLSIHFIAKLKDEFRGPRYDGLHVQAFEIQVRTMAMDAWASVSHHLDYKTDVDVPTALRKDFQALSALFYLADTHFEMFYDARQKSRNATMELFEEPDRAGEEELNYDTLAALLRGRYPGREHADGNDISVLLGELSASGYKTVASLTEVLDRSVEAFDRCEADSPPATPDGRYSDVGAVRISLAISDPAYRELNKQAGPFGPQRWERYVKTKTSN